jgi:hypothetical protein
MSFAVGIGRSFTLKTAVAGELSQGPVGQTIVFCGLQVMSRGMKIRQAPVTQASACAFLL